MDSFLSPIHYQLHLEPNLKEFTFNGVTEIDYNSPSSIKSVQLHAKELEFVKCTVMSKQVTDPSKECSFALDPKKQEATITFPQSIQGEFRLKIEYRGLINDELMGFYRSKYEHNGKVSYIAVTQFEEREARRAFPCVDHPAYKATFDIELLIDSQFQAISNTVVAEEIPQSDGRKLVKFTRTPKMCTYVAFFGVGDFEFIQDKSKQPFVRVVGPPGRVQFGEFGLDLARKSLDFCQEYTGIPYPLPKCDHIAVADFAFGAMENWGAVTYRENLLLVYPGKTSKPLLVRIASIIAHETSHMWFGNLVSPLDWKYIWLNESFASYFTHAAPDKYFPQWELWNLFITQQVLPGMERDALKNTVAIELPTAEEIFIDSSSAPIIYNKGASILRMLISYLGDEQFQQGTRHYVEKFKYQCATSSQFWETLESKTGIPVKNYADSWVYRPGYPVITVIRSGSKLKLRQDQFQFSGSPSTSPWLIPLTLTWFFPNGRTQVIKQIFDQKTTELPLPAHAIGVKLNSNQTGFYRVKYDKYIIQKLLPLLQTKQIGALDRFGIENDAYAFVRRGDLSIAEYLDLLEGGYSKESDTLPLLDITYNLRTLFLINKFHHKRIGAFGRKLLENVADQIGFLPKETDSVLLAELRNALLWSAYLFGSEVSKKFAIDQYKRYQKGEIVPADIFASVIRIGVAEDPSSFDFLIQRALAGNVPEPERMAIYNGIGSVSDVEKLRELLEITLTKVPKGNRMIPFAAIGSNKLGESMLWDWLVTNWPRVVKAMAVPLLDRILLSCVPMIGMNRIPAVKQFLNNIVKDTPFLKDTNDMTLEITEIYSKLK